MATRYQSTDLIGASTQIDLYGTHDLSGGDDLVVARGVSVVSTEGTAIVVNNSYHVLSILGTVVGDHTGIKMGDNVTGDLRNTLHITEGGFVQGSYGHAVNFVGGTGQIVNDGTVVGGFNGIHMAVGDHVKLVNNGSISGRQAVVATTYDNNGDPSSSRIINHGTITGTDGAVGGGFGQDRVTNRGTINGDVNLSDGDDVFDNRGGRVEEGQIDGSQGNDRFIVGAGEEIIEGGWAGTDTLDFRTSNGQRVSLADDDSTGWAAGDIYTGIERVLGSRSGADAIIGDAANNTFMGLGGNDALAGGTGSDTLAGGRGKDHLHGGAGDDEFWFQSPLDAADTVADFSAAGGNNDAFRIDAAGFGAGLVADTAIGDRFVARADNLAQDGNDRFVFRTTDKSLWFDADGNGGGAAVMLADLQAWANVTASDILLV